MSDVEFFTIKKEAEKYDLVALRHYLKKHNYNSWTLGSTDKYSNFLIPIRWDRKPDSDWGRPEAATGIIVLKGYESLDEISAIEEVIKEFSK